MNGKTLQKQYKQKMSDYESWEQKSHAEDWVLFPENIGSKLSIDETSLTNGELYTIITNKIHPHYQGVLVAIVKGTKSEDVCKILNKIPLSKRQQVKEVTLDMANSMDKIVRQSFPEAELVIDRFHVQQLASQALQDMRVKYRWEAIKEENAAIKKAKQEELKYQPFKYSNGDTKKQLLARARYLLFKPSNKWSPSQQVRATILFTEYPELKHGHNLSMMLRSVYEHSNSKEQGLKQLEKWYKKVEQKDFATFITAANSIENHQNEIVNYFNNRSTNASAEGFNAMIKAFRGAFRGVNDVKFFMYRVAKIYA